MPRIPLAIAICVLFIPAFGQTPALLDTTLCRIAKNPSRFHNKIVRVRGTAVSGLEASLLIEGTADNWKEECGRIWLHFGDSGQRSESTLRFLALFGERTPQPSQTECNKQRQQALLRGMKQILDPNASAPVSDPTAAAPTPTPCEQPVCMDCRRYSIVATFTGKLRYWKRERPTLGFGHLNAFEVQLDVKSVSNLKVTNTTSVADTKR